MRTHHLFAAAALSAAAVSAHAQAITLLTFADPSEGTLPLFTFSGGALVGGWVTPGLTLQTPGLIAPDYVDAKFQLANPLTVMMDFGIAKVLSGGQLNFTDSADNHLLTISFSSAILSQSLSVGGSDFVGNNVVFSGPVLGGQIYANEAFAFSFANVDGFPDNFQVTAAFTSSADLVPAPGSAALAGVAGLLALRRRR